MPPPPQGVGVVEVLGVEGFFDSEGGLGEVGEGVGVEPFLAFFYEGIDVVFEVAEFVGAEVGDGLGGDAEAGVGEGEVDQALQEFALEVAAETADEGLAGGVGAGTWSSGVRTRFHQTGH